ncbi:MAG TPA: ATP-binding protein [Acidimicrobiales bacterium]|nr:ATP-binding protein [Acidimicrobiales bacterium]
MADHGGAAQRAATTAAILRALSTLAPDRRKTGYDVAGSGPTAMAWLGTLRSNADDGDPLKAAGNVPGVLLVDPSEHLQALQRYDALNPDAVDLRIGWMWVVGTIRVDGEPVPLRLPMLSRPARVQQLGNRRHIEPVTAWDLWALVDDPDVASQLEVEAVFGGGALEPGVQQALVDRLPVLRSWVQRVLGASGLPPSNAVLAPTDPTKLPTDRLQVVAGYGIYADVGADPSRPKETLANWSVNPAAASSALATLYLGPTEASGEPGVPGSTPITCPFPLTDRQRDVVHRAGRDPITVVSGPPGTGKSQTAAAAALHAIAKGQSVLVATQSTMAADVLADLLDRVPGPTPVLFGGSERGSVLAQKLADGIGRPAATDVHQEEQAATAEADSLAAATAADLRHVAADAEWRRVAHELPLLLDAAPALLDSPPIASPAEARDLVERCHRTGGMFSGWRRRRAERSLRALVGAPGDAPLATLERAVQAATVREDAHRASVVDRSATDDRWQALVTADASCRAATARALADDLARRPDEASRRAVAALATALRSGRAARHSHLNAIDVRQLTKALPLWVGTLGDIEHLLPATAAAFDVVILDEASQIDQLAASAALLRARRAVVIGDPRQLRFVSFLSDREVRATLATEHLTDLRDRLDLRRVSAFDLAASSAPVAFLDEHFRSVPHLIGFSAERFYDGRLSVATRHPRNESLLAIEVRRLAGVRANGVNATEVEAAVELVAELLATTSGSIGVVSPYRPQVDALRHELGARIPIEQLQLGRVRAATVHGMQGAECDVVIASFGVSAGGRGRSFLEDPNLFNVLVTRARHRLIALVSEPTPTAGLLADYLRWADRPPTQPPDVGAPDRWTQDLASVLADQGVPHRVGYPVGRWTVDLVLGDGPGAVGVATHVHPAGPTAHIDRHLALALAGWRQAEAFPVTHDGDPVTTALALSDLVRR